MGTIALFGIGLILLVFIVGSHITGKNPNLTTGFVPGVGGGPGNLASPYSAVSPSARPSRLDLQLLLTQHGTLAANYLMILYDGKDATQAAADLNSNSQKISDMLADLGANRSDFLNMWQGHISSYTEYTNAEKSHDEAKMNNVKADLANQSQQMGITLNQIIPNLPPQQAASLVQEHINLTLAIVDAHAAGDLGNQASLMTQASTQAIKFANAIADALNMASPSPSATSIY